MKSRHACRASRDYVYKLKGSISLQVIRFPEAVEAAVEELMPNRITDYLYDLSEKFNGFYTECHVSVRHCSRTLCCSCCMHLLAYTMLCFGISGPGNTWVDT